jgi:hypothetical protein
MKVINIKKVSIFNFMSEKYYKTCLKNAINFHPQFNTEINYFSSTWEVSQIIMMTLKPGKK